MSTIYVDELRAYNNGHDLWCHMWIMDGNDQELDRFARKIGLRPEWAHTSHGAISGRFYHYDLRPNKRNLALAFGAEEMSLFQYVRKTVKERYMDYLKITGELLCGPRDGHDDNDSGKWE